SQYVSTLGFEFPRQTHVVVEVVFAFFGIRYIARIADTGFSQSIRIIDHGPDTVLHVLYPVERIENPEQVDPVFPGFFDKGYDQIVVVRPITYSIEASVHHLQDDIADPQPDQWQSRPWIFLQKPQGYIKRSASPYFHRTHILAVVLGKAFSALKHIQCSHSGRQQRLMSISECSS